MKKKITQVAVVATLVALATIGTSVLAANKTNVLNGVFANVQTNEYGCVSNCTAEYYASDLFAQVRANPSLSGTENVRIIVKASKPSCWFQDVNNNTVYTSSNPKMDSSFKNDWIHGKLVTISGTINGLQYHENDIVGLYGTINWIPKEEKRYSYDTVEILNPVIYKVNDNVDFSLINETPVYLQ